MADTHLEHVPQTETPAPTAQEVAERRSTAAIRMQAELMIRASFTGPDEPKAWTLTYAKRFRELVEADPIVLDRYKGTEEEHEAALKEIEADLYS